ncbi:Endoribonuclease L-PSP/chorismate mutase-like protein [Triangularia setosa]|uniref:Endoribonuclease L-PSP/chorismate mutase-like protein n=1 Tax=Triangularia setosa TaxID=2587417 RepID=A0AAN6W0W6_9PEZI|nr:Endoribonuclease L-PSP/chorismate mutase-like protein [Podospora setosa]
MTDSTLSSKPVFFTYIGYGETLSKEFHYSQAVRIGNRIEISGQGGWDPSTGAIPSSLADEIEQAFSNVELTLQAASPDPSKKVTWRQVYSVRSFHTPASMTEKGLATVAAALKKFCGPDHRPILTAVGTPQLALPGMNIEIEVVALMDLNN